MLLKLCHEGMTGKRGGENVTEVNINIVGMSAFIFLMEFLFLLRENTFITPLLMMSLHCVTNDIIVTS